MHIRCSWKGRGNLGALDRKTLGLQGNSEKLAPSPRRSPEPRLSDKEAHSRIQTEFSHDLGTMWGEPGLGFCAVLHPEYAAHTVSVSAKHPPERQVLSWETPSKHAQGCYSKDSETCQLPQFTSVLERPVYHKCFKGSHLRKTLLKISDLMFCSWTMR